MIDNGMTITTVGETKEIPKNTSEGERGRGRRKE